MRDWQARGMMRYHLRQEDPVQLRAGSGHHRHHRHHLSIRMGIVIEWTYARLMPQL